jgi:membrane protein DedA with SNARE-associated domain
VTGNLITYGYVVLVLGVLLEGDATLATAGFLANRGYFSLTGVIVASTIATAIGNHVYYHIARRTGQAALARKAAESPRYARVCQLVARRGTLMLLFSRYVFGFRIAIPALCGAVGMTPRHFVVVNLVGAVVWSVSVALAGYFFGHTLELALEDPVQYERYIAVALAVGVFLALLWFRRRDFQEEVTAVRHPADLAPESAEAVAERLARRQGPVGGGS